MGRTTPERWNEIEALFHAAREVGGEEREAVLSRADAEMRRGVEDLLAQTPTCVGVVDRPAWELADELPELTETDSQQLKHGDLLGPYRIEAKIGAGGMGEVYRATDTRLQRTVAIKVCPAQFSFRFEREARAIATLNHPNICQIYDIGPDYLVME